MPCLFLVTASRMQACAFDMASRLCVPCLARRPPRQLRLAPSQPVGIFAHNAPRYVSVRMIHMPTNSPAIDRMTDART